MPIETVLDITSTHAVLLEELNDAKKKKHVALQNLQKASAAEWEFERGESEIERMRVEITERKEQLAAMTIEMNMIEAQLMRAETDTWRRHGKPQAAEITMAASEKYEVAFLVWKAAQRKFSESKETLRSEEEESSISSG